MNDTTTIIYPMNYNPVAGTKIVEESDRWMGTIPPLGTGNSVSLQIYVKDINNQSVFYPRKNPITITTSVPVADNIVVNEIMADNDNTIPDPAGEYDDWIELYNPTSDSILLSGKYLTDKADQLNKWQFTQPDLYLSAGEYLLIWCDEDSGQVGIHTNFALSKSGEYVAIVESDGVSIIDSITFGQQTTDISYGRFPDATGNWYFMETPTPGSSNIVTSVNEEINPQNFNLSVFPNPFNPSTTITYTIPEFSRLELKIYDILGREVRNFNEGEKPAGTYTINWNGQNDFGILMLVQEFIFSDYMLVKTQNLIR